MWFRRPRVEDMPKPEDVGCLSDEEVDALSEPGPFDAPYPIRSKEEMEDADRRHPLAPDAFLAWHAQASKEQRRRADSGVSAFEGIEVCEEIDAYGWRTEHEARKAAAEEPQPMAVAAPPPTIQDTWRTTQEVWVSWLRGKKRS